ncbi:iron ABC transporter permease [Anaerovibrio sp.]|uniref:FecCD family ABC transporter permease n=1 Tax=Anaerovibrio sp. TaxID=1872532 RepID=UPI0025E461D1|nr:iron ABC transporter permease [Anaerovibrio sp.]
MASESAVLRHPRALKRRAAIWGGLVFLVAALILGASSGIISLSWTEVREGIMGGVQSDNYRVVYLIRTPRVLCGALAGLNLALSGCILQGILRNPLADPGIIGVTAGAGLFAMFVMIILPEMTTLVPIAAFMGAILSVSIVFALSWDRGIQPLRMILAGVAVATFFGGAQTALMVFYSDKIQGTINWMAGGFQGASWTHVTMILPYSLIGLAVVFLASRWLNALQLGEETARSIGVNVERVRLVLLVIAAVLAASAVSVAGMLGFVGLVVPHMVRLVTGVDFDYLLPASAIWGASFIVITDTVARTVAAPVEIPVGVFMSFLGAPFFLYLLKKGMKQQ